mmetsp:Transcript_35439/g.83998  ORF Transcript_35439/g.83998 Transcript_35439/m.83998 type:complete len:200 (-) Transcript_35439:458-1057(-)
MSCQHVLHDEIIALQQLLQLLFLVPIVEVYSNAVHVPYLHQKSQRRIACRQFPVQDPRPISHFNTHSTIMKLDLILPSPCHEAFAHALRHHVVEPGHDFLELAGLPAIWRLAPGRQLKGSQEMIQQPLLSNRALLNDGCCAVVQPRQQKAVLLGSLQVKPAPAFQKHAVVGNLLIHRAPELPQIRLFTWTNHLFKLQQL